MTAAALVTAAKLSPGLDVLVIGAAGGVGSFVVQLAGARVIATGRAGDEPYLVGLGASLVLDHPQADIPEKVVALTEAEPTW
ncbi:hypothetical protein [Nonomuraea sp. NPDC052265]|uniref:hypothetical protein n=1 Tax=Nonomuraea sp. NPDC052265 TaxID=3364374 RepID=UPI0037C63ED7